MKTSKTKPSDTRIVFSRGTKTILRPILRTDLERCHRWLNDREVTRNLLREKPMLFATEEKWFNGLPDRKNDFLFAIETLNGVHIGNMGIHQINWIDGTATTGAVIGEKAYWNKGYGTDAKQQVLDFAFNTLNLRKLCSAALSFNGKSLGYSKKCGYVEEGRLRRQVFRDGQYHDLIQLAIFKEDWQKITGVKAKK